ncbi:MAG: Gfo/Idh/MocA family oxidoreductase [Bryobacterales bacterium]|nr:Gfo/Idh/MocA family oxidoreductase [Bryobacterales bacterium]MEB2361984.1 Gfo/Idh/MocA family oxidoreductase [Bryobacterales bacterium]
MSDELSRRNFIRNSAGAALVAGPAILPALGANEKVQVGWIGTGSRGNHVMGMMYKAVPELVTVTAVCDTYTGNLNRAKDAVQTQGGNTPKTYVDYREVLRDPSIDVVFICTPEHLHHEMAVAALNAGKHIYLEKPLAHTIEEGWDIVNAAKKAGKVVQVGTQNRSNSLYIKAKEMVEQGMIGDIHYVRAFWYRNSLDDNPAWRYRIPPDADPQNTDWKRFLGPASNRPFDKQRYYQWRLYWDYSGGISTDLLVHQTDITNFVCGKTVPYSCMASGGIYRWTEDDREVPDCLSAIYEYPDRFHINYSCYFGNDHFGYGEQFMGNEGTIEVNSRQFLSFWPEKFGGKPPEKVAARQEIRIEARGNDANAVQAHVKNFIMAVLGKEKAIAPVEVGQQAAISGHMATLSFRRGKKILWDDKTNKYRFV